MDSAVQSHRCVILVSDPTSRLLSYHSGATEVGDKQAMDLLKRTINKLALQKMTHNKAVTSPQR